MNINILLYYKVKALEVKSHQLRNVAMIHPEFNMGIEIREQQNKVWKKYNFFKQLQKSLNNIKWEK